MRVIILCLSLATCQPVNLSTCRISMWFVACLYDCINNHLHLTSKQVLLEQPSQVCQHPILTVEKCLVKRVVVPMASHEVQVSCRVA